MGFLFAGKYEVIEKLAQGGMAQVYLAKQKGMDGFEKIVVIKRILPHLAVGDDFIRMFLDEARTAADLRHSNIVNIYEVGESEGNYFMAMEFLHGRDMRKIQRMAEQKGESIPIPVAMEILRQAAMGLNYAHSKTDLKGKPQNIVHRDISPHNLIVTFEGTCKVVDFGIAKAESQTQQTASGVLKGKYSYMSPEQAGGKPLTSHSDQYALGIVAWETLLMKRLFRRDNEIMTLHAILRNEVPLPTQVVPDFPKELEAIIMKMLAPKAEDRFASCQEAALAIEDFLVSQKMAHSSVRVSQYLNSLFAKELNAEDETGKLVLGNTSSQTSDSLDTEWNAFTQSDLDSQAGLKSDLEKPTRLDSMPEVSAVQVNDANANTGTDPFKDGAVTVQDDISGRAGERIEVNHTSVTRTHAGPDEIMTVGEAPPKRSPMMALAGLGVVILLAVGIGLTQKGEAPATPPSPEKTAPGEVVAPTKNTEVKPQAYYLQVTSKPIGATIRFNGKDWGPAPVKIPVKPSALPFEVEGYLSEFGLIKVNCFVKPGDTEGASPCLLVFKKAPAAQKSGPAKRKATKPKPRETLQPVPAAKEKSRPKLQLID